MWGVFLKNWQGVLKKSGGRFLQKTRIFFSTNYIFFLVNRIQFSFLIFYQSITLIMFIAYFKNSKIIFNTTTNFSAINFKTTNTKVIIYIEKLNFGNLVNILCKIWWFVFNYTSGLVIYWRNNNFPERLKWKAEEKSSNNRKMYPRNILVGNFNTPYSN